MTTPIRLVNKGRPRTVETAFPVILPSSWLRYSLHVGGEAFLGGHPLDAEDAYCNMLADFWQNYAAINPECAVFKRPDYSREFASRLIPMAVHGDEGRGKAKHPIMILSVQPVIGPKGPDFVNTSGYLAANKYVA